MAHDLIETVPRVEPANAQLPGDWAETLRIQVGRIKSIAGETEAEFLATGERLHDFYRRAGEIVRHSSAVSGLIESAEVTAAIGGLKDILERMDGCISSADGDADQNSRRLESILGLWNNVDQLLSGFTKIHKILRSLGISTKIESARLGQSVAGFDALADDVGLLSVQVREKVQSILGHKTELIANIRRTIDLVRAIGDEQRTDVRLIVTKARESLDSLIAINARCSAAAGFVADSAGEVSRNVGEVVTSMQFHDIVRQQVEHVRDALEELRGRLPAAQPGASSGDYSGEEEGALFAESREVCAVQAAQLRHARDELVTAVMRIVDNLLGIADRQARIADATREVAGGTDVAGSSSFAELEQGLSVVTTLLGKSATANRQLAAAVATLAGTVEQIAGFVRNIELIGEEIELLALNAQIKAVRLGADGAALAVLAEAVQRLSLEARQQSTAVAGPLMTVANATGNLCGEVDAKVSLLDVQGEGITTEVGGMLQTIRRVNGELTGLLARMDASVISLSADIAGTTAGITVHTRAAAMLGDAIAALEGIVREAQALSPESSGSSGRNELRKLAGRYTMQSERLIHETVTGAGLATAPLPAGLNVALPAAAVPTDDFSGLGDNVELF